MRSWILLIIDLAWITFLLWGAFAMEKGTANSGVIFAILLIYWQLIRGSNRK